MKKFLAVLHARNMEFLRDRSALAWNFAMPFLLVFGLAFTFSGGNKVIYKIGIVGGIERLAQTAPRLPSTRHIQFIPYSDPVAAINKVRHHQMDMLIDVSAAPKYWVNTSSPNGYLLERIIWGAGADQFERQVVEGAEIRYVDWFLPGILGMNMMFACLFGVGFVIVRYRKNGFLKRPEGHTAGRIPIPVRATDLAFTAGRGHHHHCLHRLQPLHRIQYAGLILGSTAGHHIGRDEHDLYRPVDCGAHCQRRIGRRHAEHRCISDDAVIGRMVLIGRRAILGATCGADISAHPHGLIRSRHHERGRYSGSGNARCLGTHSHQRRVSCDWGICI